MGNYLSNTQNSNSSDIQKEENSISQQENKNNKQQEIIIEFYKSRKDNKFANLEKAIGLK